MCKCKSATSLTSTLIMITVFTLTFNPLCTKFLISTDIGGKVRISSLAVLQGITKVKCSFVGAREVTPQLLHPFWDLLNSCALLPLSLCRTIMHPAIDGFTWESWLTSSFLSHYTRTDSVQFSLPSENQQHNVGPGLMRKGLTSLKNHDAEQILYIN